MGAVFLKVLNMGITASWLIIAICILRLALRKMPKWITCILWAFVAIRLICPFTMESPLSLMPYHAAVPEAIMAAPPFTAGHGLQMHDMPASKDLPKNDIADGNPGPGNVKAAAAAQPDTGTDFVSLLSIIWIAGISIMAIYSLASYLKLCRNTRISMPLYENIVICDKIDTPFILGTIRPYIYLPSDLENGHLEYVIAHEKAHIARLDHWWKLIGFFILSIYWFHPLCWISYILFCRDIETACDEHVMKTFSANDKKRYAQTLLAYSRKQHTAASCPLSFGEIGAEERIRNILHYKKPALWIVLSSLAVCIITAACFLTDPAGKAHAGTGTSGKKAGIRPELAGDTGLRQLTQGNRPAAKTDASARMKADMDKILSLKVNGYQNQTLEEFSNYISARYEEDDSIWSARQRIGLMSKAAETLKLSGEDYNFLTVTLPCTESESDYKYDRAGQTPPGFSDMFDVFSKTRKTKCHFEYAVTYSADYTKITVGQRDSVILNVKNGMKRFVKKSTLDPVNKNYRKQMKKHLNQLVSENSSTDLKLDVFQCM